MTNSKDGSGELRRVSLPPSPAVSARTEPQFRTGGQFTKLKLVKRQMYGRGKIDQLQARLIGLSP